MLFFCIPSRRNKQSSKIATLDFEIEMIDCKKLAWGNIIKGLFCLQQLESYALILSALSVNSSECCKMIHSIIGVFTNLSRPAFDSILQIDVHK